MDPEGHAVVHEVVLGCDRGEDAPDEGFLDGLRDRLETKVCGRAIGR